MNTDPKAQHGALKPNLFLLPLVAMYEWAKAHMLGARKYGAFNWRKNDVCASTYISAAMRHLAQWKEGEDIDEEAQASHLGMVMANCAILLDAQKHGKLVDDRPRVHAESPIK